MFSLETLIRLGGLLHISLLVAGALLPFVLDWRSDLKKLDRLSQQVVWTHGVFIVLVVVGFAAASLFLPDALVAGTPLARSLCGFIALFWLSRLVVQLFCFDAEPHLTHWFLRLGYRGLTGVFTYLAIVYAVAAAAPFGGVGS
jgi:hypothetical protein